MKHTVKVTALLLMLFVLSQFVGLFLINTDLVVNQVVVGNETVSVANYSNTAIGEVPEMNPFFTLLYLCVAVGAGTILILILRKFNKPMIWRYWFFLAVSLTTTIALYVVINYIWVAFIIGFSLGAWKVFRPNVWVHNLTEVLMYAGIAIIFVRNLNILAALILLLVISLYDMYAVWKSKHMIDMAQFQSKSGVFGGLNISYNVPKEKVTSNKNVDIKEVKNTTKHVGKLVEHDKRQAILGGGDIAFPMIFSGVVMEWLIIDMSVSKPLAYLEANIITLFVAAALGLLFYFAKKDKFYPAMPFVTAGALLAYGIILAINLL